MAFTQIDADKAIMKQVMLEFTNPPPVDGWPGQGVGTAAANKEAQEAGAQFYNESKAGQREAAERYAASYFSRKIPIQFPPRIRGNSKAANWTKDDQATYEPVVTFQGSTETKITIELKYVITGGKWSADAIASAVHTIMGYFYRTVIEGTKGAPLIKMKLYQVAPDRPKISYWRMDDASVSQSDELILDGASVYPQVTTVTMNLCMVTQIGDVLSKGKTTKQGFKMTPEYPLKEWY